MDFMGMNGKARRAEILLAILVVAAACEQDLPLSPGVAAAEAQLQLELTHLAAAKEAAAIDAIRVLVWHARQLPPPPAGKAAQIPIPGIDFEANDWLAWASYLQVRMGFDRIPERSERLRIEAGVARGALRVRAGVKYVFVGVFAGGELRQTGETEVVALPGRVNRGIVEMKPFEIELPFTFSSEALAALLRERVGSLLPGDLAALRSLDASNLGIADLSGIEQLAQLEELDLSGNQIADVSPLAALTALTRLDLSNNQITDVSALARLGELLHLDLSGNRIADIAGLLALPLTVLDLRDNPLSAAAVLEQIPALQAAGTVSVLFDMPDLPDVPDVPEIPDIPSVSPGEFADAALAIEVAKAMAWAMTDDVTEVKRVTANGKGIDDLNGLQYLTGIEFLDLGNNDITNIQWLVANPGLGQGDRVILTGNPLSEEAVAVHIPALRERGVVVEYDGG